MAAIDFNCLPTIVGSMPHSDAKAACDLITGCLKDIPVWPQLTKRVFLENMYAQYSEGFPGVVIDGDSIYVNSGQDLTKQLEEFYTAYLENDADKFAISPDHAEGLDYFLGLTDLRPRMVKGQVAGPVTWGLTVTDENKRAIIYDDVLGDAVARLLRLKAAWQEKQLKRIASDTIIFVDEPYMAAYGSVSVMLSKEKVISLLEEVFQGISGLKGVHCCGNTDWGLILETSTDIISFDTYNYADSLALYPEQVKAFIERGGTVAWGIVPNSEEGLNKESAASLSDRLGEAMAPFTRNGVSYKDLLQRSLLTPSCGLDTLASEDAAAQAIELLVELSDKIREKEL